MFPMKQHLSQPAIQQISTILAAIHPQFPSAAFEQSALHSLDTLELKQRVHHIIYTLHEYLPKDFPEAAKILQQIPDYWQSHKTYDYQRGFAAWPLIDYVAEYGLEHPEIALDTLEKLTPLFSAEFAIRAFINQHFELTYQRLLQWCQHKNEHVRRLASEGIRPRLPWGSQLTQFIQNPQAILPLLDALKDDPSLYVRRSVANCLNDISKDHPELVIELGHQWLTNSTKEQQWIIKHATRTLVKAGHPDVFILLGYTAEPQITLEQFQLEKSYVVLGNSLSFQLTLHSKSEQEQKLVVDYGIEYLKANGQHNTKVFKLKNLIIPPKTSITLKKSHGFQHFSTRKHYLGKHYIYLLINGKTIKEKISFDLIAQSLENK